MDSSLVTICTYSDPIEAAVAKTRLDSSGIFCVIADEELMNSPVLRTVIGQVRLQVRQPEVEKAKRILGL